MAKPLRKIIQFIWFCTLQTSTWPCLILPKKNRITVNISCNIHILEYKMNLKVLIILKFMSVLTTFMCSMQILSKKTEFFESMGIIGISDLM